jgi:hypothetical protein
VSAFAAIAETPRQTTRANFLDKFIISFLSAELAEAPKRAIQQPAHVVVAPLPPEPDVLHRFWSAALPKSNMAVNGFRRKITSVRTGDLFRWWRDRVTDDT